MCIRDRHKPKSKLILLDANPDVVSKKPLFTKAWSTYYKDCLLYTSDAADERSSVDLGGRRIIKKK